MSNKTGFYAACVKCGSLLSSEKRLEHHKALRCNYSRFWVKKRGNHTAPVSG